MGETKTVEAIVLAISALIIISCLSGCTSNQNTTTNHLSGTWIGSVEMPMGVGRVNTSLSQLSFTDNNVQLTMESEMGTRTMEYTYSITGNTLVLQPSFSNTGRFPGGQPPNGTRPWNDTKPPGNWTWQPNDTRHDNGTWPGNLTQPDNRTQLPGGERLSMSVSFEYSFNEEYSVLYLSGSPFTKVQ
jgi:hypothetical protein